VTKSCPAHHAPLVTTATRFGARLACPVVGCTVACWDGPTSSPADAETRALRSACHAAFDPLWQTGVFPSRNAAYDWLARVMFLDRDETHVGLFDADQCREMLEQVAAYAALKNVSDRRE
jgi:hypothetical protein